MNTPKLIYIICALLCTALFKWLVPDAHILGAGLAGMVLAVFVAFFGMFIFAAFVQIFSIIRDVVFPSNTTE